MRRAPSAPRDASRGFALLEVTLALMLIALLAALALPSLVRGTGPAALRVAALEVSALLREDRNLALASGRPSTTVIEFDGRRVRSLTSGGAIDMPNGAVAGVEGAGIRFFADGHAAGGPLVIASDNARFVVAVSAETGAIHVGR